MVCAEVSVLFSEPKIPQFCTFLSSASRPGGVSVLFSEPKIPQFFMTTPFTLTLLTFQCSSASRKFLNYLVSVLFPTSLWCFSALQRAENSSISTRLHPRLQPFTRFSALQRAENSSIHSTPAGATQPKRVSVLFSEPKIPQFRSDLRRILCRIRFQCSSASRKFLNFYNLLAYRILWIRVSVLFSEPKIPQFLICDSFHSASLWFQCSSASRKFLNLNNWGFEGKIKRGFSALQRAENSSIIKIPARAKTCASVSVLFSEPKIPQFNCEPLPRWVENRFSALQRAENSSIYLKQ